MVVPRSNNIVRRYPPTAIFNRPILSSRCHNIPASNPTTPIPADVSIVQGPAPSGVARSLIVMLSQPTTNPGNGPAIMPAIITKKAVGLTLGGPHTVATRSAAFAAEKHATRARSLVLTVKTEITLMHYPIRSDKEHFEAQPPEEMKALRFCMTRVAYHDFKLLLEFQASIPCLLG